MKKFSSVLLMKDAEFIHQLPPAGKFSSLTGGGEKYAALGAFRLLEIAQNLQMPYLCPLLRCVSPEQHIYSGCNITHCYLYHHSFKHNQTRTKATCVDFIKNSFINHLQINTSSININHHATIRLSVCVSTLNIYIINNQSIKSFK